MANMINSGKSALEQQFVKVVGQITKEVVEDVVHKTAVASVNKLNMDIAKANDDAKCVINSLKLSKQEYDSMLSGTTGQVKDIISKVKSYNVDMDSVMSKMLCNVAQQNKAIEQNIAELNKQLISIRNNMNSLCEEAIIQGSKDVANNVLHDSVLVELGKFNEEIESTKKAFSELLININNINMLHEETKISLAKFDKYFTDNMQNWSKNQQKIIAACLEVNNQQLKTDDLINDMINAIKLVESNLNANLNSYSNAVINSINSTFNYTCEQFDNLKNDNLIRDQKIEEISNNIEQRFVNLENVTTSNINASKDEILTVVLTKYSNLKKWVIILGILNVVLTALPIVLLIFSVLVKGK